MTDNKDRYKTCYLRASMRVEEEKTGVIFKSTEKIFKTDGVDLELYAQMVEDCCNHLDDEGYDVFSIIPVNTGHRDAIKVGKNQYAADIGYSVTQGAVVVGKLKEPVGD